MLYTPFSYIHIYIYVCTHMVGWPRARFFFFLRVGTEVAFWRGDLGVCLLGGFIGAPEYLISIWRSVLQGSPQGQTLRALLLRDTSVLH